MMKLRIRHERHPGQKPLRLQAVHVRGLLRCVGDGPQHFLCGRDSALLHPGGFVSPSCPADRGKAEHTGKQNNRNRGRPARHQREQAGQEKQKRDKQHQTEKLVLFLQGFQSNTLLSEYDLSATKIRAPVPIVKCFQRIAQIGIGFFSLKKQKIFSLLTACKRSSIIQVTCMTSDRQNRWSV